MLPQEAKDIAQTLRRVSKLILSGAGVPVQPTGKTRPWRNRSHAIGIAYHWTGGPSLLRTAKWFNDPMFGNTGSSCHALVADDYVGALGELWSRYGASELGSLFPVPTLLLADLDQGTWATNWTNDRTLGVELRNLGPIDAVEQRGRGACIGGRWYERYTQEQLVCAINLGRLTRGLAGDTFDPDWVIGHSMVNAVKSDPGPDFPLHAVRQAILLDGDPAELTWLIGYPRTGESAISVIGAHQADVDRDDTPFFGPVIVSIPDDEVTLGGQLAWTAECLYRMGFNSGPHAPGLAKLKRFISWFQISTQKWKTGKIGVTGAVSQELINGITRRMKQLNLTLTAT